MNKNAFRLVFSRRLGMLVAVEETASGAGKTSQGETAGPASTASASAAGRQGFRFALHAVAFAVLALGLGGAMFAPLVVHAQIVPGGGA
ncbi:ESPR domain-containing protein [Paraburkholderia sp. SIMBA_030]|uniref:ESPR domain-containing protein n=1 Tax=Paraburkholderia sp. SIMBA_030 TaxID=3085773 RepID=UPI00397B1D0C